MATGDIVYQFTFQSGEYSLLRGADGYFRKKESLGSSDSGVELRDLTSNQSTTASSNRRFDSTKSYTVTITEA